MSRFTTELRFMLETQNGNDHTGSASDVMTVINNTRSWLFNFNYPCEELTELEKEHLEKNFMLQYYTREIGFETFGLFKTKLQAKLWEIMPLYNKLYALEHKNLDFFSDVDYTKKFDGTVEQDGTTNERNGTIEHANSGKETTTTTGSYKDTNSGDVTDTNITSNGYTDENSGSDLNLYSNTPQSEIDIADTNAYITELTKNKKGTSVERTYDDLTVENTHTDESSTERTFDDYQIENENNKKLVDTFTRLLDTIDKTDTTHNIERVFGNMGNNLDKFIKYRDNIMNLEQRIVNDCSDLFMQLWY